jgi:SpoVK/Ycf46/Vps4 family AAA+-type ATPase
MVSEPTSPEDIIKGSVNPAAPARLTARHYEHLEAPVQLARSFLSVALQSARPGVNLLIYGPPGTGKTELARLLAQQLDCPLFEVASEDTDGDAITGQRRMSALRAAQSIFARQRSLILFDEIEDIFRDRNDDPFGRRASAGDMKAWVNRTLENNAVPTLWLSNDIHCMDAAFLRRFDMHIEVDIPPQSQREWILAECTQGVVGPSQVAQLARHERLAPAVVTRVASVVKAIEPSLPTDGKPAAMLRLVNDSLQAQGLRPILAQDPNRLPELYDPVFVHADADPHAICQGLQRTLAGRLCLYGPPGTGKTAYARWIAEQCNKPLLVRRASDLMSMWVGESEKNIAKAFRQAQDEGAVLLIDEVDSFLQDRRGAQRSWEVSGVNEMLTQMESFAGLFIASTNLVEGLDPASLRRFDLKMKFDFMRPAQAWAMLQRHCEALGLAAPDDRLWQHLRQLDQLTPGDFAMIARRHRFHPLPDAAAMVQALRQELVLKRGGAGGAIGFNAALG